VIPDGTGSIMRILLCWLWALLLVLLSEMGSNCPQWAPPERIVTSGGML